MTDPNTNQISVTINDLVKPTLTTKGSFKVTGLANEVMGKPKWTANAEMDYYDDSSGKPKTKVAKKEFNIPP